MNNTNPLPVYRHIMSNEVIDLVEADDDSAPMDKGNGQHGGVAAVAANTSCSNDNAADILGNLDRRRWKTSIQGNPRPQQRPRMCQRRAGGAHAARGRAWLTDPSKGVKACFKAKVLEKLKHDSGEQSISSVLNPAGWPVRMDIIFRMKRPKVHFVGCNRERDTLKPASHSLWPAGADVDNLGKLVLDACKDLLFAGDKHVVVLRLTKVFDTTHPFEGSTDFCIRSLSEGNVAALTVARL
jgi:Holliday junction resolvase RusA-like endonuclease